MYCEILIKDYFNAKKVKLMIKYILFIYIIIFISACSIDNRTVKNPITNEEKTPGIFSKNSKGISLSDIINSNKEDSISQSVNGFVASHIKCIIYCTINFYRRTWGFIITDWYTNKNIKDTRIKITAFISTSELRSDGINVKVHVQKFKDNFWSETFVDKELANQIEDNILSEARTLRVNSTK